jgi:YaiO family outer membrane protein
MFVAAFVLAQVLPILPTPTPAPSASPGATPVPAHAGRSGFVDVDAGGSNSYLNHGKGRWESGYAGTEFVAPSGFALHLDYVNDVRFGVSSDVYAMRAEIPTHRPNGTIDLGYLVSPHNDVIPTTAVLAGYDLRTGGGWSYQFGYVGREFSSATAANYAFGTEKHWKHQRLGYYIQLATVSNKTGLGIVQGLRWSTDLPSDTVTITSGAGRGVESTGRNRVAVHDVFGIDAGDEHWMDPHTAIRADVGYFSVSKAYQRFLFLLGMRLRIGRMP